MPIKADKSLRAYYNEINPFAAQWMRNLMAEGWITKGDVDERSIEDVQPNDLTGYDRLHFFAGVAVWDYALNQAGWGRGEIWTGSCPCQPFSAAGKGAGFDDERHLWPVFHHLIKECKPAIVIGEQVASGDAMPWIDLVQTDMEALGNAFGAIPFPSAGVGAPHIRERLYWVAYAYGSAGRQGGENVRRRADGGDAQPRAGLSGGSVSDGLGHADSVGAWRDRRPIRGAITGDHGQQRADDAGTPGRIGGLANDDGNGCQPRREGCEALGHWQAAGSDRSPGGMADHLMQQRPDGEPGICLVNDAGGRTESSAAATGLCGDLRPSPINGFWADADWLLCRDGKWRPVEPGTFPLAHGAPARVGRLRAYGNSINAKAGEVFIRAVMESIDAY